MKNVLPFFKHKILAGTKEPIITYSPHKVMVMEASDKSAPPLIYDMDLRILFMAAPSESIEKVREAIPVRFEFNNRIYIPAFIIAILVPDLFDSIAGLIQIAEEEARKPNNLKSDGEAEIDDCQIRTVDGGRMLAVVRPPMSGYLSMPAWQRTALYRLKDKKLFLPVFLSNCPDCAIHNDIESISFEGHKYIHLMVDVSCPYERTECADLTDVRDGIMSIIDHYQFVRGNLEAAFIH